ncbi:MAG: hypothetical protein AB1798_04975, partial [Spirochaetota bacterium]
WVGGGLGVGASAGIGYVGNGLGLGFAAVFDSCLYGKNLLEAEGDFSTTFAFIGGLAIPINILGTKIYFGGDVRPMFRMHAPLTSNAIMRMVASAAVGDMLSALNNEVSYSGIGLGFDLGLIWELGPFTLGLSTRDFLGTKFRYTKSTFGNDFGGLLSGRLPRTSLATLTAVISMDLSAGISFHPDLGRLKSMLELLLHIDVKDIVTVIEEKKSPWMLFHAGAEIKLLSFFSIWGGISQTHFTAGLGIDLIFLELNAAVFNREMGQNIGDRSSSGVTVEAAIRF